MPVDTVPPSKHARPAPCSAGTVTAANWAGRGFPANMHVPRSVQPALSRRPIGRGRGEQAAPTIIRGLPANMHAPHTVQPALSRRPAVWGAGGGSRTHHHPKLPVGVPRRFPCLLLSPLDLPLQLPSARASCDASHAARASFATSEDGPAPSNDEPGCSLSDELRSVQAARSLPDRRSGRSTCYSVAVGTCT